MLSHQLDFPKLWLITESNQGEERRGGILLMVFCMLASPVLCSRSIHYPRTLRSSILFSSEQDRATTSASGQNCERGRETLEWSRVYFPLELVECRENSNLTLFYTFCVVSMYRNETEKKLESSVRTATHALTRGILGATHKKDGGGRKALFSRLFCCIFGERERDECTKMAE